MTTVEFGRENKEVVLLLHGGGLSWWNYRQTALALQDRFHVILPILDGHTGSSSPFTSIEENAQRVIDLIRKEYGGQILLIGGVSLGGQIAAEILAKEKDICRYAIIESTLLLPMRLTAAAVAPAYAVCYPLIKKRWFAKLQFWSLHIDPALFDDYYAATIGIAQSDMTAFLQANANYRLKESIKDCTAKTLILVGSKELPIIKRSGRLLESLLPDASYKCLKSSRHGELGINHPKAFTKMLLELIEG